MDCDSLYLNPRSTDELRRAMKEYERVRVRKHIPAATYDQAGWGSLKLVGNETFAINFPWGVYTYLICYDEVTKMPTSRPKTHHDDKAYVWFNISQVALKHPPGGSDVDPLLPYARVCRDGIWGDELLEDGRTIDLNNYLYTYHDTSQLNHQPEDGALEKYRVITDSMMERSTGTVGLVAHKVTGKIFVVKCVRPREPGDRRIGTRTVQLESFEISALRAVRGHPNICKLKEFFICRDNTLRLILEYCGHQTLSDKLQSLEAFTRGLFCGDIDRLIASVMVQLCTAVGYIHSRGFIHGDIEPNNVVVASTNPLVLKIADFGCAIPNDDESVFPRCFGPFEYIAPEVPNKWGFDEAVDSYSVGVIFYEMLRLRHNFGPTLYKKSSKLTFLKNVEEAHYARESELDCMLCLFPDDARPLELAKELLELYPKPRCTMSEALEDPWIRDKAFSKQQEDSERKPYSSLASALTMRL